MVFCRKESRRRTTCCSFYPTTSSICACRYFPCLLKLLTLKLTILGIAPAAPIPSTVDPSESINSSILLGKVLL